MAVSFFKFFEGWFFEPEEVGMEEFIHDFFLRRSAPSSPSENASYFHHVKTWFRVRNHPNVLPLFYEDMRNNLEARAHACDSLYDQKKKS